MRHHRYSIPAPGMGQSQGTLCHLHPGGRASRRRTGVRHWRNRLCLGGRTRRTVRLLPLVRFPGSPPQVQLGCNRQGHRRPRSDYRNCPHTDRRSTSARQASRRRQRSGMCRRPSLSDTTTATRSGPSIQRLRMKDQFPSHTCPLSSAMDLRSGRRAQHTLRLVLDLTQSSPCRWPRSSRSCRQG